MENKSAPHNVDDLRKSMDDTIDYKVPSERKTGAFSAIGLGLAALFLSLAFIGFSQVWGNLISYIIVAFSLFGWDPTITALFMSLVFLAVTVLLYIASKRGSEAASKMEAGLKIAFNVPPTRFYDLSEVPTANVVRELVGSNSPKAKDKGRGCNLVPHEDNVGFDIVCNSIPDTKEMKALKEGKIEMLELKERALIVVFFAIWGGLQVAITYTGFLTGAYMYIAWAIFLVAFFVIMVETRILRLWSVLVAFLVLCVFFTFVVPDMAFVWTMWGAWICGLVAVVIFYIVFKDACIKKESWYCEFL